MVEVAIPDADGTVRTITVAFRPRNKKDVKKSYISKEATRMTIGVQRFAILMTAEEMDKIDSSSQQQVPLTSEMTLN